VPVFNREVLAGFSDPDSEPVSVDEDISESFFRIKDTIGFFPFSSANPRGETLF
jgi:hypothetical protein